MFCVQKKQRELSEPAATSKASKDNGGFLTVKIPKNSEQYADAVQTLVDCATPSKKTALEARNFPTSSAKRSANRELVAAAATSMTTDKSARKSLVQGLKSKQSKTALSKMLPVSRATLHRPKYKKPGRRPIVDEVRQLVLAFYTKFENITEYPNKRRGKTAEPLRVLNFTLKRLYVKFCTEHPDAKISLTTFRKYKPKTIKYKSAARLIQCVCDRCENVALLVSAIRRSMHNHNFDVPDILRQDESSIGMATLCERDIHKPKCLDRLCEHCGVHIVTSTIQPWVDDYSAELVKWTTWRYVPTDVNGRQIQRLTKVSRTDNRRKLLENLSEMLHLYGRHVFTRFSQSTAYQQCVDSLRPSECAVVVDFSENYTCIRQGEAQSAYYSRTQVTLHPMVIVMSKDSAVQRDSVCIISDDLKHDSSAVYVFIDGLISHLHIMYPEIETIHIWSDGCAAQYKSKLPFYNISQAFGSGREILWNFFGSRHGKSPADGEAAVVKTFLSRQATGTDIIIDNAQQVFSCLTKSDLLKPDGSSRRHFYYLDKSCITPVRTKLLQKKGSTLNGTRMLHQMTQGAPDSSVIFRCLSCYCSVTPCHHTHNEWKMHKFPGNNFSIFLFLGRSRKISSLALDL